MKPTPPPEPKGPDRKTIDAMSLKRAQQALRLVCAEMPHLAGLARLVRLKTNRYFDVAAVGASGLLIINPDVFAKIPMADAAFVMAHELLHLALDTHTRQGGADPHLVNVAHDYVINDLLFEELGRKAPLGGLVLRGAAEMSLESLVVQLSTGGKGGRKPVWSSGMSKQRGRIPRGKSQIQKALEDAGLVPPEEPQRPDDDDDRPARTPRGDLLPTGVEQSLEPEISPEIRRKLREQVRREAAKALSLKQLRKEIEKKGDEENQQEPQRGEDVIKALRTAYAPPWQLALQRWLDAVAPAGRTYARASRRGADRDDLVLCGRMREGWCLHIVLDTSGSMADALPKVLGTIGAYCEAANVAQVHIVQCDIEVTHDEWLEPPQLGEYRIGGFGGSNMAPGMDKLAEDHEVSAVLVLTDGYIEFPAAEPPYAVLWALFRSSGYLNTSFSPSYGEVLFVDK